MLISVSVSRIVFIVGASRQKCRLSNRESEGKGKNVLTDLQRIVARYGTTEVLDPGETAFSEPTFINFASGFEAATQVREHNLRTFAETIPFTHI
jgi:hypothetical protein